MSETLNTINTNPMAVRDVGVQPRPFRTRMYTVSILLMLLVCSLFIPRVSADVQPDSLVDATMTFTYQNGTSFLADISLDVNKITTYTTYTKSQISSATEEEQGAIQYQLYLMLKDQLNDMFKMPQFADFEMPVYEGGKFYETLSIHLDTSFFSLLPTIDANALTDGVLDMGATVSYTYPLRAEDGWNVSYVFDLNNLYTLRYADTADVIDDRAIWTVNNYDGGSSKKTAEMHLASKSPTTVATVEDIDLEFILNTKNNENNSFTESIQIHSLNISNLTTVPEYIKDLSIIPSDGIRLFSDGLLTWDQIRNYAITKIKNNTIPFIENSSFNQSLDLSFSWDLSTTSNATNPYEIDSMDTEPPIKALLVDDDVKILICDISSTGFFGLLNAGAHSTINESDVSFGDNLSSHPYDYTISLIMPQNISLEGQNPFIWDNSSTIEGTFSSSIASAPYTEEDIDTTIHIDVTKIDLDVAGFLTGNNKLLEAITATGEQHLRVVNLPSQLILHDHINISFLNADALRLIIQENILTKTQKQSYINQRLQTYEDLLKQCIGVDEEPTIDEEAFISSLSWDKDISNMGETPPVVISAYTNSLETIPLTINTIPAELIIPKQFYTLPINNQSITYRITMPKGMQISAVSEHNNTIIHGSDSSGRDYIQISYLGSESYANDTIICTLNPTAVFVFNLFLPIILTVILIIILIAVILYFRKKKRGKLVIERNPEPSPYEDKDYYVPPPPGSSP